MTKQLSTLILAAACLALVPACSHKTSTRAKPKAKVAANGGAAGAQDASGNSVTATVQVAQIGSSKGVTADFNIVDSATQKLIAVHGEFKDNDLNQDLNLKAKGAGASYEIDARCVESRPDAGVCDLLVAQVTTTPKQTKGDASENISTQTLYFQRATPSSDMSAAKIDAQPMVMKWSPDTAAESLDEAVDKIAELRQPGSSGSMAPVLAPIYMGK